MTTLRADRPAPARLELNDIGRVTLRTGAPVLADRYADNRITGAFILIDEHYQRHRRRGHGRGDADRARRCPRPPTSCWHHVRRWTARAAGPRSATRGATVWLTGLPSSGKSTIAAALEARLVERGPAAYLLDGDNLRHGLSGDLGFEPGDRGENVRRAGEVARLLADAGAVALVSLVSPTARTASRARAPRRGGPRRSTRSTSHLAGGVRAPRPQGPVRPRARGELPGFTGVDAPYEPPEAPDLEVDTSRDEDAVAPLLDALAV